MQGSPSPPGAEEAPPAAVEPAAEAPPATPETAREPRKLEWWLVAAAAVVAVPLWLWRGSEVGPGTVIDAPISLITADKHELSCALPDSIGHYRCAFRMPDETWPEAPAPAETLTQYLTTERRLLLVPGLFERPEIAARYASEPPQGKRPSRLRRFVAQCKLRLVTKVPWVYTRWARRGNWDHSGAAWVAEPLGCTTRDE